MTDKTDSKEREAAYDMVDRFLRNNLGSDEDYAEYSQALDTVLGASLAHSGFDAADMATAWSNGFRDGVASLAASAGSEADMRAVVAVAVTMLFDSHPEDVRRTFTIAELSDMVRITEALGKEQVEDIYKRAWDGISHPSPPEGMVGGWMKGVEAVAALLSKKADDFAQEHGYDDMGGMSFGRGSHADAKLDYHSSLIELAEEVRAMLNTPPTSFADSRKGE